MSTATHTLDTRRAFPGVLDACEGNRQFRRLRRHWGCDLPATVYVLLEDIGNDAAVAALIDEHPDLHGLLDDNGRLLAEWALRFGVSAHGISRLVDFLHVLESIEDEAERVALVADLLVGAEAKTGQRLGASGVPRRPRTRRPPRRTRASAAPGCPNAPPAS